MNEGKILETSKPTKMRMENEPWDSALFDWKPTKFYLCPPLLKGGNSRILWNSPKKFMLMRGFNAQTDKEQILYLIL